MVRFNDLEFRISELFYKFFSNHSNLDAMEALLVNLAYIDWELFSGEAVLYEINDPFHDMECGEYGQYRYVSGTEFIKSEFYFKNGWCVSCAKFQTYLYYDKEDNECFGVKDLVETIDFEEKRSRLLIKSVFLEEVDEIIKENTTKVDAVQQISSNDVQTAIYTKNKYDQDKRGLFVLQDEQYEHLHSTYEGCFSNESVIFFNKDWSELPFILLIQFDDYIRSSFRLHAPIEFLENKLTNWKKLEKVPGRLEHKYVASSDFDIIKSEWVLEGLYYNKGLATLPKNWLESDEDAVDTFKIVRYNESYNSQPVTSNNAQPKP